MAPSKRFSVTLDDDTKQKVMELRARLQKETGETVSLASVIRQGVRKLYELSHKRKT